MDRVQAELAQEKDGGGGQGGEAQGKVVAPPVLSFRESLCDQSEARGRAFRCIIALIHGPARFSLRCADEAALRVQTQPLFE